MSRGSHGTVRGRTRSHGIPTSRSSTKLSIVSPRRSHGKAGTTRVRVAEIIAKTDLAVKTGLPTKTDLVVMTGPAAKTGTITKTVIRKAKEKGGMKRKKFHFAISMAKIKVIGPMNAQLQLKRRQSSTAKTPSQQNQSITPRNHRNKFPFHPLPGLQHQIGQYLTQSTTTTRHTHLQWHYLRINPCHHLRTRRCRCYPPHSMPTRGQGAPFLCHHHQSLSQDRSWKEQPMPHPAVWSTSSMPSPEGPMNQCTRRRDNAKNISEQCLM